MQKITTYLTFKDHAEDAMKFYISLFDNSKIVRITRSEDSLGPIPKGGLLNGSFVLDGEEFMAMDGGDMFEFGLGSSLFVTCENQDEIDHLWDNLADGGEELDCGWLRDKFGLVWQIIPSILVENMHDKDPERSKRVMEAMLKMKKIDIKGLRRAYDRVLG